jgi:hypothetical protein
MKWMKWILAYVFDCVHPHTSWPHCNGRGLEYVCCLDCGRELPYSTRRMSIVTKEVQLEDLKFGHRNFGEWEFSSADYKVVAGFSREGARAL